MNEWKQFNQSVNHARQANISYGASNLSGIMHSLVQWLDEFAEMNENNAALDITGLNFIQTVSKRVIDSLTKYRTNNRNITYMNPFIVADVGTIFDVTCTIPKQFEIARQFPVSVILGQVAANIINNASYDDVGQTITTDYLGIVREMVSYGMAGEPWAQTKLAVDQIEANGGWTQQAW